MNLDVDIDKYVYYNLKYLLLKLYPVNYYNRLNHFWNSYFQLSMIAYYSLLSKINTPTANNRLKYKTTNKKMFSTTSSFFFFINNFRNIIISQYISNIWVFLYKNRHKILSNTHIIRIYTHIIISRLFSITILAVIHLLR